MPDGLFFFYEGPSDARYIDAILRPIALDRYKWVGKYMYACKKTRQVCGCLNGLPNIDADYVFLTDKDDSPCISHRQLSIIGRYPPLVQRQVVVAVAEIESWYIAGVTDQSAAQLGIAPIRRTEGITKEGLARITPRAFDSRIDFMSEILNKYSLDIARQRNASLDYLVARLRA